MANNHPAALATLTVIRLLALAALLLVPATSTAQAPSDRFNITRFTFTGNTLLESREIAEVLSPFVGEQRDAADVQKAIEAIRTRYSAAGFAVAGVIAAEQDLVTGDIRLQIIEARIGKVTVQGNRFFDEENIRRSLPTLARGSISQPGDISANAQLINQNPAKQLGVTLKRGDQQGVIDAVVDVVDVAPLKAYLTVDNTGNRQTGANRLGIGLQHANLFSRDHVGTLSYVTSPEKLDQVKTYSGSYRWPLYTQGDSVDLIAAYSDVSAGTTPTVAGPLSFSGRGTIYGLHYNQLLARQGAYSQRLVYAIDYRAYKNDCTLGEFGEAGCGPAAADITTRPLSLTYSGNWEKPKQITDFYVALSRNLPGDSHGHASDFNAVRRSPNGGAGANARYTTLRYGASMVKAFANNWQVRAAVNAQHTDDALISGEQFNLSGATAVRGFMEREIARDTGYFANFELYSPRLSVQLISDGNVRGVLFYDLASAANQPLAGEEKQQISIASAGVGVRWSIGRNFNLRFDLAKVIDEGASRSAGDYRGHLSLYFGT